MVGVGAFFENDRVTGLERGTVENGEPFFVVRTEGDGFSGQ